MAFRFLPPQPSVCPGLHRARWRIRSRDADYSGGGNIGACDGMAAASHGRCALRRATRSRPAASSNAAGGLVNSDEPRGYNFDIDHDYFERVVWPALAHRFPAFEACRCRRTWSGLYEQNELDGNPVIGRWSGRMENFLVVAGFSGHGMMHAPAAGRAIAELIVHNRHETIDLTRFGYQRIEANEPYRERGIL